MVYSLTINIDSRNIKILSTDGSVLTDVPNIVGLNQNDKIISIGKTPGMLQEERPKEWEQEKDKICFFNLFFVDSFRPEFAASTIDYLTYFAIHPSPKAKKGRKKDTVALQVIIPEYENLAPQTQEIFEYHIQETGFVKVKSLTINSHDKPLANIRKAERWMKIGEPTALVFMSVMVGYVAITNWGEQFFAPIPMGRELLAIVIVLAAYIFLIYLTDFIYTILWKFATRNLVSGTVSRLIVERNK